MSVAQARSWLKSRAESIKGMRAYSHPGQTYVFPCVVFDWAEPAADYVEAGSITRWSFKAYLLLNEGDATRGYESLDEYVDKRGGKSILYALEADATNKPIDHVLVRTCDSAGAVTFRGGNYYGAEFTLDVWDTCDT